jgi:hypothetical protein
LDDYVPAGLIEKLRAVDTPAERQDTEFTERNRIDLEPGQLLDELRAFLFSTELVERAEQFSDLAWRLYWSGVISGWQAFVSRYDSFGMGYDWHVDQGIQSRALNWIINLDDTGRAAGQGGELQISAQPFSFQRDDRPAMRPAVSMAARTGKLVMFPACYPHRVTRPKWARTVAHGHFLL